MKDRTYPPWGRVICLHEGARHLFATVLICWRCGATLEVKSSKREALPEEAVRHKAQQAGWHFDRRGRHDCKECQMKDIEPRAGTVHTPPKGTSVAAAPAPAVYSPAPSPSETPPRSMSPGDRRRIFREIDECYDETNSRYVHGFTDAALAEQLKVPRKWVEIVREESFGPPGESELMRKFAERLEAAISEARTATDKALAAAEVAEQAARKLEAIETEFAAIRAACNGERA